MRLGMEEGGGAQRGSHLRELFGLKKKKNGEKCKLLFWLELQDRNVLTCFKITVPNFLVSRLVSRWHSGKVTWVLLYYSCVPHYLPVPP